MSLPLNPAHRVPRLRAISITAALLLGLVAGPVSPAGAQSAPVRGVPAAGIPDPRDAPIALLVDLSSGQTLFAREAERRFVPASITKVMTAYTAFDLIASGKLDPARRVSVSDAAFRGWHRKGSTMFLGRTDTPSVDDLLHGITTVSANDGCIVLAEGVAGSVADWVALMNREARALGMDDSHYGTPNGWMDDGNTFVTARDLATLAAAMIERHPALYHHYIGARQYSYGGITQSNHDPITGVVEGADGIKTGFTNQAGYGFLGTATRNGRRLVMVVAGSDSGRQRNTAARALMEWGFTAFNSRRLFAPGAVVGTARVQGGGQGTVPLLTPRIVAAAFPHGRPGEVAMQIRYQGPLAAPIAAGQQVAMLELRIDGGPPHAVPLLAAEAVAVATPLQRLRNGLAGLLS